MTHRERTEPTIVVDWGEPDRRRRLVSALDGPHRKPGLLTRFLRWLGYWLAGAR